MNTSSSLVSLETAIGATLARLTIGSHVEECELAAAVDRCGALHALHGSFPSIEYYGPASDAAPSTSADGFAGFAFLRDVSPAAVEAPAPVAVVAPPAPVFSDFGSGNQVTDETARARIMATYDKLEAAGVTGIDRKKTVAGYVPGVRMAQIGYRNQEARHAEFLAMRPAREALESLTSQIQDENRQDVTISARDFARSLHTTNGRLCVNGLALSEHAIRGVCTRIESPAIRYILGMRERIAAEMALGLKRDDVAIEADRAKIADVLQHECARAYDVQLKMRTRRNPGDVYAITSPTYAPADQPEVARQLMPQLPAGARASVSYDPGSTQWSLRLDVWTPTPVADHAVGEAFQGYVQIGSRDNGTGSVEGSGGIVMLACLNAGTYQAAGQGASRRHVGRVLLDVSRMIRKARASIDTLCAAWGEAREATIEVPSGVSIEDALPGFWRHLLTDRRSELVSVLPGRTESHVKALARTFDSERRDSSRIVRADMAHAWTRYVQDFPAPVQRAAEAAIGEWTVSPRPIAYVGQS
jgi:hypothetical protein